MRRHTDRRKGSTLLEFTLVGIPLLFVLISVFEMARGMWIYHTLGYAVKEGTRFAIVHGRNCGIAPNNCQRTVGQIATRIQEAGVGLLPNELNITMTSLNNTVVCRPLSTCLARTDFWPTYPGNQQGMDLVITGTYPFESALAMFWPGAGAGINFPRFTLPAASREAIQF